MDVSRKAIGGGDTQGDTQGESRPVGRVPAIDLGATHADLRQEIETAAARVFASGRYIGGPEVEGLESEFAAFCGVPHAVAVASGTDALRFSLMAAGAARRPGRKSEAARESRGAGGAPDEVITSPLTFIATTEAVSQAGAKPVFVDVDPESLTLDPGLLEKGLTPRTMAIVPVHLYGQTADMDPILELARARGLAVIEDACQAHGAQYRGATGGPGRMAGALGDVGCFSFYPTKNLGGCGEGGMVTTASPEIAARARLLCDHGQSEKYVHAEEGYNGRLDALQAAILRIKLRRLAGWNARRRALAAQYTERLKEMGLAGSSLRLPVEKAWGTHVYHLYTVRVFDGGKERGPSAGDPSAHAASAHASSVGDRRPSARDRVRVALLERGIETGVHYPIPLHLQPAYAWMGLKQGSFPVAERAAREVLSLPLYPEMSEAQVERVCEALRDVLGRG
jgi:dTDP-4-amino-4,6-dideoxygalactose transaminase